jgi:hypothetical protein
MKLTREQVAQLSDVELNLAMIWLYWDKKIQKNYTYMCSLYKFGLLKTKIEYLTDYNLTMPLAFENKLSIFEELDLYAVEVAPLNQSIIRLANKNPLRAICEVLLMIAMERDK